MAATKSLNDLMLTFMQDIYYAERQILKALPKLAMAAHNEELKQTLMHHRDETQGQVERLQKAFELIGKRARSQTCEAILEELPEGIVRDAGILANAQAVEHYEMTRYGTTIAWAKTCGEDQLAQLMHETVEEEKKADSLLKEVAKKSINRQAARQTA